jgi:hypothetical protein
MVNTVESGRPPLPQGTRDRRPILNNTAHWVPPDRYVRPDGA